jgi:hypothetical protein
MKPESIFLELEIPKSKNIFEKYFGQYEYQIKTTSSENSFQRFLDLIGGISEIKSIRNKVAFDLFTKMTPLRGKKIAKEIALELRDGNLEDRLDEIITKKLNSPIISSPVIKTISDNCSHLNLPAADRTNLFGILEVLNRQKLLLRGKYFECSNCQTYIWYQLDQIEREVKCYACNSITSIPVSVGGEELVDSYKLNELVMTSVDQGVIPVLYVLSYIHEILVSGYHYLAGIEITDKSKIVPNPEIDLIVNCIGKIGLFEIKAQRGFERKQFDRLIEVAKKINADFIVLAALLPKDSSEMVQAKEWLKNCGVKNSLLSFEDILIDTPKKNKDFVRLLGLF